MPMDLEFNASHTRQNNWYNLTFSFNICTLAKIILLPITKVIIIIIIIIIMLNKRWIL